MANHIGKSYLTIPDGYFQSTQLYSNSMKAFQVVASCLSYFTSTALVFRTRSIPWMSEFFRRFHHRMEFSACLTCSS